MRKTLLILLCIPFSISAQQYPDMNNQPDMQKMMQVMKKMQECMQKVDKTEIKKIEQKSKEFGNEVQSLCSQGKRTEAQTKALKFAKNMMNNPIAKKLKQCTDIMMDLPGETIIEDAHVCDSPDKNHQ